MTVALDTKDDRLILVGKIVSVHGIRGEVVIRSFTAQRENILSLPLLNKQIKQIKIALSKSATSKKLICRFNNCSTRNEAESLIGIELFCLRKNFPELAKDEFYLVDLKGIKVKNINREHIGMISDIFNFGASDLIEVKFIDGTREMFSFTEEFFPEVHKDYVILTQQEY